MMRKLVVEGTTLIIVPHSDDEVLLFGGLIQRLISNKTRVFVALVTNGDYEASTEQEGQIRPLETIAGLKIFNVPEQDIILMGYADTGMPRNESFLAGLLDETDGERIHVSRVGVHTYGPSSHPDYHSTKHGEPASYTRNALCQDIADVIRETNPRNIFTTHPLDVHGDHSALYHFVKQACGDRLLFSAFAHSCEGDIPLPDTDERIPCPVDLMDAWDTAVELHLTPEEVEKKRRALEEHVSALKPDAIEFLRSYVKCNEVYFPMEEVK